MNDILIMADDEGYLHNIHTFIDNLFGDLNRFIRICIPSGPQPVVGDNKTRGSCVNLRAHSTIYVWPDMVRQTMIDAPCGGNRTFAKTVHEGVMLVLTHELQHAAQYAHGGHWLWQKGLDYYDQPHEVDARRFVDQNHLKIRDWVYGEFKAEGPAELCMLPF